MICPNLSCRRTLSAPRNTRGKLMRCAYCNAPFRVPRDPAFQTESVAAEHDGKQK